MRSSNLICIYILNINLLFIKIIVILTLNYNNIKIINKYINKLIEMEKSDKYLKFCSNFKSNKIKKFKNFKNPEISVISPVYNRKNDIIKFLKSIQYQNFENLELILVDDCSIDDTLEIIKNYTYKDKRIKIIKNKKRKGTFLARNIGVVYSKGKYILIPDPDDIIINNILSKCYKLAEKYQYDIIRFIIYDGNKKVRFNNLNNNIEKSEVNQPKLSTFIFYSNNELKINDFNIYNKFIKKDIYIISLISLNKFYLRMYMTFYEDQIINYILHRTAKSLIFIENIGYYYLGNIMSITKNVFKSNKIIMLFTFIYLKFIFEYSKNLKYEKDMANTIFSKLLKNLEKFKILFKINNNNNNYKFFYKIINMYSNSKFILKINKYILLNSLKND